MSRIEGSLHAKAAVDSRRIERKYGSMDIDLSDDESSLLGEEKYHHIKLDSSNKIKPNKRWSVLEKLERQYGENTEGKYRHVNSKCIFATVMLTAFIICGWYFTRTLFFNLQLNPELYDFIVVGGGPAGAVVTRRFLDEGAAVLLLEAGNYTQFVTVESEQAMDSFVVGSTLSEFDIPLLWSSIAQASTVHWGKFNALNIFPFKGLGGGSMHSAMLHIRAVKADITRWGLSGWDWDRMTTAYETLERFETTTSRADTSDTENTTQRSLIGSLPVQASNCIDVLSRNFIASAMKLGENNIGGFNSDTPRKGVGCYETSTENGIRVSAPNYLLRPYLEAGTKATRLTLRTRATVRKIILTKEVGITTTLPLHSKSQKIKQPTIPSYRAIGVEYEINGEVRYSYLSNGPSRNSRNNPADRNFESHRSIVLSAGAILTPKLLLSSGIGPVDELQALGIETKVNGPRVGKGLKDHLAVGVVFQAAQAITDDVGNAYSLPQQWSRYIGAVQRSARHSSLLSTTTPTATAAASARGSVDSMGQESSQEEARLQGKRHTAKKAVFRVGDSSTGSAHQEDFGLLGRNGISAGAFLVSPYADDPEVADIQLSVFPSVTEPHYLALMESKSQQSGANTPRDQSIGPRNQILITATLLYPDAEFQVTLNTSRRRQSNPNVLPGNFALTTTAPDSSSTHSDVSSSSSISSSISSSSAILLPFLNNGDDATSPSTDPTETPVLRPNPWVGPGANIIPAALSDRDVLRLTWAVQRVRELMAGLAAEEDHPGSGKGLFEVSPGIVKDNRTSTEADYLNTWVRENVFFQSNWVGSAAMGATAAPSATTDTAVPSTMASWLRGGVVAESAHHSEKSTQKKHVDDDAAVDDNSSDSNSGGDSEQGEAQSSVLDEELRVRGVVALRVVDASAIPSPLSGNIQATVQAVAHQAADIILTSTH